MTEKPNRFRFRVENDTTDELLGYKADTHWDLSKRVFKAHSEEKVGLDSPLFDNFLWCLNRYDHQMPTRIRVTAERVSVEGSDGLVEECGPLEETAKYLVAKNRDGKYEAFQL